MSLEETIGYSPIYFLFIKIFLFLIASKGISKVKTELFRIDPLGLSIKISTKHLNIHPH